MGGIRTGNGHHTRQDEPGHTPGTRSGSRSGGEPGIQRKDGGSAGRPAGTSTPRFATGINPSKKGPIDPSMPHLPPA